MRGLLRLFRKPLLVISIFLLAIAAYVLGWTKVFVVEKVIIDSKDKKVVREVLQKINQSPAVIETGQPLARVDRREIATRLREMLWIENVKLDRRLFSGELHLEIVPRNPVGRLVAKDSTNLESIGFMDKDLEYFFLPAVAVNRAISSGEWSDLPEIAFLDDSDEVRAAVRDLLQVLADYNLQVRAVAAKDQMSLSTKVLYNGRKLDISWGSVNQLELKLQILERLMLLKANRNVTAVNLSNPVTPIVS